jgi:predicted restriction endonuclease
LFWEGENAHGSDKRILLKNDFIHVFYRERERSDFVYQGRAELMTHKLFQDRPSKFIFQLIDKIVTEENLVEEVKNAYGMLETVRDAIIKSRVGQGLYRSRAINLWRTCSVTGFTKKDILIASHIKPWKVSSNEERLNPYNSLVLVPTLDKLFDKGLIGFESSGKILISDKVSTKDCKRIGLTTDLRLSKVPDETKSYLDYHCEYKFDLSAD